MGLAEEFDEEEGPLEEHIQRLTDSEKQVEVLKAALEAEKKKSASGDFCQIVKCNRHVDWWCHACQTALCHRCSTKIVCDAAEKHSLEEFEDIFADVKGKFVKWRNEQEEKHVVLEFRQDRMIRNINNKKRELSEASDDSFSDQADRLLEIAALLKKLHPLSKQVMQLKLDLMKYGDNVDRLSKPEYFCVVKVVVGSPVVDMCTKVVREPTGLDFISNKKTSRACMGVNWTEDGTRVLCAMVFGVEVRGDDGELIRKVDIDDPQYTYSAHLMADRLYTQLSSSTTNKYLTYVGTLDEPLQSLLHEVEYEAEGDSKIHLISVSHNKLAIIDIVNTELRICTPDGTHMYNIKLKDMIDPYGVELLPADNSVLVTDWVGNQLRKYRLEPDAKPVWTCTGLKKPSGVTTDKSGLIYVTSSHGSIYLISPQGEKIKELNHPMLKESVDKKGWIHDISVSDGKMVVACGYGGVMYFNLL